MWKDCKKKNLYSQFFCDFFYIVFDDKKYIT